jgi:DNA-binding transcriptional ArsR family regulator
MAPNPNSTSSSSGSPLEAAAGAAGPAATEAFKLLSDETRLAILLALWEAHEPFADGDAVGFSALRDRVGTADSGRFNYHLDRLTDHFVRRTDDGYELREAGLTVVRSVIAGAGFETPTLEPTPIDMDCGLCGGDVVVVYHEGSIYNRCTDCDGLFADGPDGRGYLSAFPLPPAGFADRSPGDLYAAAWVGAFHRLYAMLEGVCPTCSGPVDGRLSVCDDHDPDGVCEGCGRAGAVTGRFVCSVCKERAVTTLGGIVKFHPAVVALHYEHGLTLQYGFNDLADINRRLETGTTDTTVASRDPLRVDVTVTVDGDAVTLRLARDLSVLDVREMTATDGDR